MSIFLALAGDTVEALRLRSTVPGPAPGETVSGVVDLGDDDTFMPHDALLLAASQADPSDPAAVSLVGIGGDSAARQAAAAARSKECDNWDGDGYDEYDGYDDALDDLGEWASSPAGAKANLTARVAKRTAANIHHAGCVERIQRAEDKRREHTIRDRLDRATVEQVLDPRTRMILFRMLSRGQLLSIEGCVSTGKESNVYYGKGACGEDVAVKVFKTAILTFKDRERYVAGEFRFRKGGYHRSSNRKMVRQWAEKEYRNLLRMREAGLHSPAPMIIKPPILVMSFFGRDGWPAPRLKDAVLSSERMANAYVEVCCAMRRMYRYANLVHGDLSEYNILYHQGKCVIIDVSQSVEDDHPMALDFLRRDCANVNDFFHRFGVSPVLSLRELFDFVTCPEPRNNGEQVVQGKQLAATGDRLASRSESARMEAELELWLSSVATRSEEETEQMAADDQVFMQSFIPRRLDDITDADGRSRELISGTTGAVLLAGICALTTDSGSRSLLGDTREDGPASIGGGRSRASDDNFEQEAIAEAEDCTETGSAQNSGTDDDAVESDDGSNSSVEVTEEETKAMRKQNKKMVKAAARERREKKTPKHVKKRKETLAKRRRHIKPKK